VSFNILFRHELAGQAERGFGFGVARAILFSALKTRSAFGSLALYAIRDGAPRRRPVHRSGGRVPPKVADVWRVAEPHILGETELVGTYAR
jgi:hypothetical protein